MCVDHRKEGEENDYEPDCVLDPDVIVFRQQGNRQSVRFPVWDYGTHLGGWDSGRIRTDAASALYNAEMERQEAIRAGERALASLRDVEHYLGGARLWGIVDMFGGGGLSGLIKHAEISKATQSLERAKSDLRLFQKELRDVDAIRIDIGGFLTFADFFFDGIIADWLVQSKIQEARRQVADAINQVEWILGSLRSMQ